MAVTRGSVRCSPRRTLTGGERGDILNKAMERPRSGRPAQRSGGLRWPGPRDPGGAAAVPWLHRLGSPKAASAAAAAGDRRFALEPSHTARPLVRSDPGSGRMRAPHLRRARWLSHPYYVKTHEVCVAAFEACRRPDSDRYWGAVATSKLYDFASFSPGLASSPCTMRWNGAVSRIAERGSGMVAGRGYPRRAELEHHRPACPRSLLRVPRSSAARARHPDRPGQFLVRMPGRGAASGGGRPRISTWPGPW